MDDTKDVKHQNLLFVHEKVLSFFNEQQKSVEHIVTKIQLVIVADTALVGFILNKDVLNSLDKKGLLLACLSILAGIFAVWPRSYKFGPKIEELIAVGSNETFNELVIQYNDKLKVNIKENSKRLSDLICFQKLSITLLVFAVVFLVSAVYY